MSDKDSENDNGQQRSKEFLSSEKYKWSFSWSVRLEYVDQFVFSTTFVFLFLVTYIQKTLLYNIIILPILGSYGLVKKEVLEASV